MAQGVMAKKRCQVCRQVRPRTAFKRKADGTRTRLCRRCLAERNRYQRAYRHAHPEQLARLRRRYRDRHRAALAAYQHQYYLAHKAQKRRYVHAHQEQIAAYQQWYRAQRGRTREAPAPPPS